MPRGFDIFNQQPSTKKEEPLRPTAPTGSYTWFGPPDVVERFRFSVIQENGDDIQLVPGTAKFKKGIAACGFRQHCADTFISASRPTEFRSGTAGQQAITGRSSSPLWQCAICTKQVSGQKLPHCWSSMAQDLPAICSWLRYASRSRHFLPPNWTRGTGVAFRFCAAIFVLPWATAMLRSARAVLR